MAFQVLRVVQPGRKAGPALITLNMPKDSTTLNLDVPPHLTVTELYFAIGEELEDNNLAHMIPFIIESSFDGMTLQPSSRPYQDVLGLQSWTIRPDEGGFRPNPEGYKWYHRETVSQVGKGNLGTRKSKVLRKAWALVLDKPESSVTTVPKPEEVLFGLALNIDTLDGERFRLSNAIATALQEKNQALESELTRQRRAVVARMNALRETILHLQKLGIKL